MRVLQISAFCGWSITGRIPVAIHHVLEEQGFQSMIAWGRVNTAPSSVPTIQIGSKPDQYAHGLYTRLTDRCGFGSKHATKVFLEKVDEFQPDLVHLHILHGYYINLDLLFRYLKEKHIPVIWTFHDCWAITGHCPYFDMVQCDKWKTGCHHCPQRTHHPTSWLMDNSRENWEHKKALFTSLDHLTIVTPSKWLAGIVRESFLHDNPVEVINNGINTDIFRPIPSGVKNKIGVADKKIVLGVSSSWVPSKGLGDFIQLMDRLPDEYQIVLVGLTEKQLKKLPEKVIGIQRTDSLQDLAELYSAAHVFVNPTYEDNYPTTNLEAMACGTPVITYRTGGSVEAVEESSGGLIVERGDVDGICAAIKQIENKKTKVPLFECDERKKFQEYILLYHKLLSNRV